MKNFERLNKNKMKMVVGGGVPVAEIGGDGSCCTAECMDENYNTLGTISLGDTCLGGYWDCRDFYPTAHNAVCSCS
jgi:hypothetical protein